MDRATRDELILKHFDNGFSTRAIGRAVGCSHTTAADVIRNSGADTNREQTRAATQARVTAARAAAADTANRLIDDVEAIRVRAWSPSQEHHSTPDGVETIHTALPNAQDLKALTASMEATARTAERLKALSGPDNTADNTKSVLGAMMNSLAKIVNADREETEGI